MTPVTLGKLAVVFVLLSASEGFGQSAVNSLNAISNQARNVGGNSISEITQGVRNQDLGGLAIQTGVGGTFGGLPTNAAIDGQNRRMNGRPQRPASSFNVGSFGSSKPFSNSAPDNTVSPYLNLFINDSIGGDPNFVPYQSLVRPQQNQSDFNRQVQAQGQALSRRVQEISAKPAFNPQGSEQQLPTGHSTVFGNTSHFYPQFQRRR